MPVARYWRVSGLSVYGAGDLELSEVQLYSEGGLLNGALSCPFAPSAGTLAMLTDGLATGVATWPKNTYSQAGFFLGFDFGAAGVDVARMRLGAGSNLNAFPRELTLSYSSDGVNFQPDRFVTSITVPAPNALTELFVGSDPLGANVDVFLPMRGSLAESARGLTVTVFGNPIVEADSVTFDSASYLRVAGLTPLGTRDFTVESFSSQTRSLAVDPGTWQISTSASGLQPSYASALTLGSTAGSEFLRIGSQANLMAPFTSGIRHLCVERFEGVTSLYVNGLLRGSMADPFNYQGTVLAINGYYDTSYLGLGVWQGFRLTRGVARYQGPFTQPTFTGGASVLIPQTAADSWSSVVLPAIHFAGQYFADAGVSELPKPLTFNDIYYGGEYRVYGTVKKKGNPTNTPLRRRVILMDERSQISIRETWSNAVTGDYEFRGVRNDIEWTTVSYDHTGIDRAVIANGQIARL